MDIIKCLDSKEYCGCLSGGLCPVQGHADCTLALFLHNDNAIKS